MAGDWLAARRTEVAADRILDAAGELFAAQPAATVGMHEIATAAGCSRATLYRYFENREALHTAYVHREAYRLYREMTDQHLSVRRSAGAAGRGHPGVAAQCAAKARRWHRGSPPPQRPIGGEMADQSEVIKALAEAFVDLAGPRRRPGGRAPARWLVRVMTSLLMFPGRDEADERGDARGVRGADRAAAGGRSGRPSRPAP